MSVPKTILITPLTGGPFPLHIDDVNRVQLLSSGPTHRLCLVRRPSMQSIDIPISETMWGALGLWLSAHPGVLFNEDRPGGVTEFWRKEVGVKSRAFTATIPPSGAYPEHEFILQVDDIETITVAPESSEWSRVRVHTTSEAIRDVMLVRADGARLIGFMQQTTNFKQTGDFNALTWTRVFHGDTVVSIEADGCISESKLAFLNVEGVEWRLDSRYLMEIMLTPLKKDGKFSVTWVQGDRPDETTIEYTTAQDIIKWLTLTNAFLLSKPAGPTISCPSTWTRKPPKKPTISLTMPQQTATAHIDVALERVILLARRCGQSDEFASDIAEPLKLLLRLMIRDVLVERDSLRAGPSIEAGETYHGQIKQGAPLGPVDGRLRIDAYECLHDVVSHAADFRSALAARLLAAVVEDGKTGDAPGAEEAYWRKQQLVFDRMVEQAKRALDAHAKVAK